MDLEEHTFASHQENLELQERKRKYALHGIWNAIFYLVKTGCQWSMLPCNFAS